MTLFYRARNPHPVKNLLLASLFSLIPPVLQEAPGAPGDFDLRGESLRRGDPLRTDARVEDAEIIDQNLPMAF